MTMYDYKFGAASLSAWAELRHTWFALNRVAETRLNKIGSTPETIAVLWACRDHPGPLHPAEIARLVFRSPHTVAGLLNRMEKDGLVTRIPKEPGHPYTEVKITPKGEALCEPGIDILKDLIAEIMSALHDEDLIQFQELAKVLKLKALAMMNIPIEVPKAYLKYASSVSMPMKNQSAKES